jgi:hypothetical protein
VRPPRSAGAAEREWLVLGGTTALWTLLTPCAAGVRRLPAKLDTGAVGNAEIGGRLPRTRLSHSECLRGRATSCLARQGAKRPARVHRAATAVNSTSHGRGALQKAMRDAVRDDPPCQLVDHAPARCPSCFPNAVRSYLTASCCISSPESLSRCRSLAADNRWQRCGRLGRQQSPQ